MCCFDFLKSNKFALLLLHPVLYPGLKSVQDPFQLMVLGVSFCHWSSGSQRHCHTMWAMGLLSLASRNLQCWRKWCVVCREITSSEGGHLLSFTWSSSWKILSSSSAQAFLMPGTVSVSWAGYDLYCSSVTWDLSPWLSHVFSSSWTGRFCTLRHK